MAKMEHIYTLERMKTWSKDLSDDEIEAIAYALNTLNQEPCKDAISRKAVLKAIKEWWRTAIDADGNPSLCDDILALPPVAPTQGWIPCSERLPEEDGDYLLFGKIDEDEENYIFIGEYDSCGEQFGIWQEQFDRTTLGCLGSEFFEYSSVIAWMPLPKPYEGESEDKGDLK